jgi:glycosyltransferase involved in cell wall biosynthesis
MPNDQTALLYLAAVDWQSIRQRPQHLALRLAHRFHLTYVNPVGLRSIRLGDVTRLKHRLHRRRRTSAPFPLLNPWYVPLVGINALDAWNRRGLVRQIAKVTPIGQCPWILWLSTPSMLAEALIERSPFDNRPPSLVVYDCMDRYAAFHNGWNRARIERAERAVAARADVVFTSSRSLAQVPALAGREVVHVANGVDYAAFALPHKPKPPAWRRQRPGPIIGYHGTLGEWLDFELLEWLARQRPGWTFVLIGPCATGRGGRFFSLPNVLLPGPVDYTELPAHTAHFDVGIVPFVSNELTRCVHPIKALEYLAAGLPTVSCRLSDLAEVSNVVSFADSPDEWLTALDDAVQPATRAPEQVAARRAAAQHHTWDDAARRVDAALRERLAVCGSS